MLSIPSQPEEQAHQINIIWELTQAVIALAVCGVTLYISAVLALASGSDAPRYFLLLGNSFFLIVGFYFGRTNHTRLTPRSPAGAPPRAE